MLKKIKIPLDVATSKRDILPKVKSIIAKAFRKINCFFLEDEEDGERAPLKDHLFYYGLIVLNVGAGIFFAYELMTI